LKGFGAPRDWLARVNPEKRPALEMWKKELNREKTVTAAAKQRGRFG
jgi:hypothetical protein